MKILKLSLFLFLSLASFINIDAKKTNSYSSLNHFKGSPSYALNEISRYNTWRDLIGKKLTLIKYGLIGDDGREANVFYNNTGEYMKLQSNGILVWNNKQDGDSSYYYHILGNKVYFGSSKGSEQYYFELISTGTNTIKTHDKLGTYRYLSY